MYPIKLKPILKQHIWGGEALLEMKRGQHIRVDRSKVYGESWDVSGIDGNISVISNGFFKGNNLQEAIEVYMGELVGESVFERYGLTFPLLLKTLHCKDRTSVQVHPDDDIAAERHDSCGKTEMWYIVDAEPGALLHIGFKNPEITREQYIDAVAKGTVAEIIEPVSIKAGDAFLIPSGTVHSISGGVTLIEIQQPVDLTYRIFDWNRVDDKGKSRELHTALAVDAIDFSSGVENCKREYTARINEAVEIASCDYFTCNILKVEGSAERNHCALDSFVLYYCTEGSAEIATDDGTETIRRGEVLLLPADTNEISINGTATLLEYYVD
ncbi:MAG: class I mannose-6-phosphate isomerase [Alistipes sp.]|nr:class I mannose-6-phosphate isomerase [Alistipes sp.]